MIDIRFEINGKPVDPNRMGDAIEKAILGGVVENMKKKLQSVRCKTHGKAPKITVKGKTIDKLSFEVSGCCQDLIDQATAKLK
jgi:hypothetical protein